MIAIVVMIVIMIVSLLVLCPCFLYRHSTPVSLTCQAYLNIIIGFYQSILLIVLPPIRGVLSLVFVTDT